MGREARLTGAQVRTKTERDTIPQSKPRTHADTCICTPENSHTHDSVTRAGAPRTGESEQAFEKLRRREACGVETNGRCRG